MHQLSDNIMDEQLLLQLNNQVEICYQQAEKVFKRSFPRPLVRLDLRGHSAGTATPQKNLLRFNKQLLSNHQQHFLKQTVPHEVSHLLAYYLCGLNIKPHGKEWQLIMQAVYCLPAERCHPYPLAKKKQAYYLYRCQCSLSHPLTIRRHNAINKGQQYICKHCKGVLTFTNHTTYQ